MTHPPIADRPANMGEYGVPDDLDGVLPWSWAAERLSGYRNYWLTTVSNRSTPHSMPVWGVWLDHQPGFYFSCSAHAFKVKNISANSNVVVGGDDTVEVVSLEGVARIVTDQAELDQVIETYITKYLSEVGGTPENMDDFLRANAFYAVDPRRAFGMIERPEDFGPKATRWTWAGG